MGVQSDVKVHVGIDLILLGAINRVLHNEANKVEGYLPGVINAMEGVAHWYMENHEEAKKYKEEWETTTLDDVADEWDLEPETDAAQKAYRWEQFKILVSLFIEVGVLGERKIPQADMSFFVDNVLPGGLGGDAATPTNGGVSPT